MSKPLKGVRVLDLTKVLAGPLCTQYLGEMGADIVKVEPVQLGDETRGWPPFRASGLGAVFMSVNRNKRSVALNLKTERGRAIVHRLAKTADVAIESFGTGVAERLGIDAETLRAINPRLIHCSISGFGREGPMRQAPGYDVILQAFCGVMALTGEEGGSHIRSPISPIDQMTGMHALTGILAKLYERQNGGSGGTVNVSLYDTAMGLMAYNLQSFWERGVQPQKCGSSHESLCPYQALEAADGPIMLGVANDNLWRKFCAAAGLDGLADDPEFRTNADRVRNREQTLKVVQEALLAQPAAHWYEVLSKAGIPISPIHSLQQLLDHPHTQATGMVMRYDRPGVGELRGIAQPVRFDGAIAEPNLPPPRHGEHTEEVLAELGLTAEEIAALPDGAAAA